MPGQQRTHGGHRLSLPTPRSSRLPQVLPPQPAPHRPDPCGSARATSHQPLAPRPRATNADRSPRPPRRTLPEARTASRPPRSPPPAPPRPAPPPIAPAITYRTHFTNESLTGAAPHSLGDRATPRAAARASRPSPSRPRRACQASKARTASLRPTTPASPAPALVTPPGPRPTNPRAAPQPRATNADRSPRPPRLALPEVPTANHPPAVAAPAPPHPAPPSRRHVNHPHTHFPNESLTGAAPHSLGDRATPRAAARASRPSPSRPTALRARPSTHARGAPPLTSHSSPLAPSSPLPDVPALPAIPALIALPALRASPAPAAASADLPPRRSRLLDPSASFSPPTARSSRLPRALPSQPAPHPRPSPERPPPTARPDLRSGRSPRHRPRTTPHGRRPRTTTSRPAADSPRNHMAYSLYQRITARLHTRARHTPRPTPHESPRRTPALTDQRRPLTQTSAAGAPRGTDREPPPAVVAPAPPRPAPPPIAPAITCRTHFTNESLSGFTPALVTPPPRPTPRITVARLQSPANHCQSPPAAAPTAAAPTAAASPRRPLPAKTLTSTTSFCTLSE